MILQNNLYKTKTNATLFNKQEVVLKAYPTIKQFGLF